MMVVGVADIKMKFIWSFLWISFGLNAQGFGPYNEDYKIEAEYITAQTPVPDHHTWDVLLKRHVSVDGVVNYQGFTKDLKILERYIESLAESARTISTHSKQEQLAFWINAYNACTVKLICDHLPLKSIKDIKRPWKQTVLKSEGKSWTLDEIEHKILRNYEEPRIHFAINCASKSCPILSNGAYSAVTLEAQLNQAAERFFNDASKNQYTPERLYLSRIFLWFKGDFGKTEDLIELINRYTGLNIQRNTAISYLSYDWSLNN